MNSSRVTFVFDDCEKMAEFVIAKWKDISSEAIRIRGRFTAALSGGKTPIGVYRRLASEKSFGLLWNKTHIFFVDERFVPHTDADSNYRMIKETLLDSAGVPPGNIHPINTDLPDLKSAAERYERDISLSFRLSGDMLPEFDLVMLGVGTDGHTASLFPGSTALEEKKRITAAVILGPEKHSRITLTLPSINNARNVMFLVTGSEKAKVLRAVVQKMDLSLPAALVAPEKGDLLFLADSDAGLLIKENQ